MSSLRQCLEGLLGCLRVWMVLCQECLVRIVGPLKLILGFGEVVGGKVEGAQIVPTEKCQEIISTILTIKPNSTLEGEFILKPLVVNIWQVNQVQMLNVHLY